MYTEVDERAIMEAHRNARPDNFTTGEIMQYSKTVCRGCHLNQFNIDTVNSPKGCYHLCIIEGDECIVYREGDNDTQ